MHLIKVIPATKIPLANPQALTYFTAHELNVGGLVLVPLHKRKVIGVVESIEKMDGQKMALRKAEFELRGIAKVISGEQIIDKKQLQLAKWMSEYYWCPIGAIIKLMIPTKSQKHGLKLKTNQLKNQKLILVPEISFIENIAKQNELPCPRKGGASLRASSFAASSPTTPACNALHSNAGRERRDISPRNKIKDCATLHSELTDKQYFENWLKIKNGEVKTIVATRMALFAPFQNLKEIIVENEHNDLYKSRQTPRYHARETALKLAEIWGAKITLKSPTPSVEASWLTEKNRDWKLVTSNFKNKKQLSSSNYQSPITNLIDLRTELKDGNFSIFSRLLQEKIKTTLDKKQQIILFINRRGASTVLQCRDCGYVPKCQNCEAPMVYHLAPIQFLCHHCGHSEIPPVLCPNCLGTRIKYFGTGTQKVEIEFKKLFPDTKTARLDSDTIKTLPPLTKGRVGVGLTEEINNFNSKKTQVLIGTQIIFNKGLDKAPLVAMMIADTFLYRPDFRSNERTFQIISQLKNLSSRESILQTYSPENIAVQTAVKSDYKSFYKQEIEDRQELNYPPFSQLIKLTYQHRNAKKTEQEAKILVEKLKQQITANRKQLIVNDKQTNAVNTQTIIILGPSPAFIPKTKGKHIWQIVLKCKSPIAYRESEHLKARNQILKIIPPDWVVDVDPIQII
jgi:primosomal protein N' (replication factor Y)